jgi:hypothetical protein
MTHNPEHLDLERLGDFVDHRLKPFEHARADRHLAACERCRHELARLRALLAAAAALPEEIDPPGDVWSNVSTRLTVPRVTPVRGSWANDATALPGARKTSLFRSSWLIAAAAVVLIVVTATVTTLIVREPRVTLAERSTPAAPPAPAPAPLALPAAARALEADYAGTVRELDDALARQRASLRPETVAKIDASIRVIDGAIAELRRALAEDPANTTLLDILSASYERKLELLRRAVELPAST